jgi:hypothetical protein
MNAATTAANLRPQIDRRRLAIAADRHSELAAEARISEHLHELRELLGDVSAQVGEPGRAAFQKAVALVSSAEEQSAMAAAYARRAFEKVDALSRGG